MYSYNFIVLVGQSLRKKSSWWQRIFPSKQMIIIFIVKFHIKSYTMIKVASYTVYTSAYLGARCREDKKLFSFAYNVSNRYGGPSKNINNS